MEIKMRKPNFLCVGFAKCGTTTLHEIFKQHPDIYLPEIKETRYYWLKDAYSKGFLWYLKRYYSAAKKEKAVGEINPNLTVRHLAPKIAADFAPDAKIIFLVRNPVKRLYSNYKYFLRFGTSFNNINLCVKYANRNREGFDQFIDMNFIKLKNGKITLAPTFMKDYIEIGKYYSHIKEYYNYFPKNNIKVVLFEDFILNPEAVTKELFDFLEVDRNATINYNITANEGNLVPRNINSIYSCEMLCQLMHQLYRLNSNYLDGYVVRMQELVQRKILFAQETDKSKMSNEAKMLLEEYYSEDKKQLESLLKKDLKDIWF